MSETTDKFAELLGKVAGVAMLFALTGGLAIDFGMTATGVVLLALAIGGAFFVRNGWRDIDAAEEDTNG